MSSDVSEAIEQLARRLHEEVRSKLGNLDKVSGVKNLTEEVLIVASDAVQVVTAAAPLPKPSGKAQLRLLCRLVAAVMGSAASFDEKDAAVIGKRLQAQVARVRAALAGASAAAAQERADAQAAAAIDLGLLATLPVALAAIDAKEQKALAAPSLEPYNGFWELELAAPIELATPVPVVQEAPRAARAQLPRWLDRQLRFMHGEQLCVKVATSWPRLGTSGPADPEDYPEEYGTDSAMRLATFVAEMDSRERWASKDAAALQRRLEAAEERAEMLEIRCTELEVDAVVQEREKTRLLGSVDALQDALQRSYGCRCMYQSEL